MDRVSRYKKSHIEGGRVNRTKQSKVAGEFNFKVTSQENVISPTEITQD